MPWVVDLKKQLLLPSSNFTDNPKRLTAETTINSIYGQSAGVKTHKRTISDIPHFDEDAESVGSLSLDSTLDHEVFEGIF